MELMAINLAEPRVVEYKGRRVSTGIYKVPVSGPVRATRQGLVGDVQIDRQNHGGPDKAVYGYTLENYRFWEQHLGSPEFPSGQFGENLTVLGMPDEAVHIGDVFRIGGVLLQVTQPRVPCYKLGIKMGDPGFVEAFLYSGRVGFYLRVLEEGEIAVGNPITRTAESPPLRLNLRDAMQAIVKGPRQRLVIEQALEIEALSEAWRTDLQKRLSSL